jgi:opacity protein-like surface antigen
MGNVMWTKQKLLGSAAFVAAATAAWPAEAGAYLSLFGGLNITEDVGARSGGGGIVTAASTATLFFSNGATTGTVFAEFEFEAATGFSLGRAKADTGWTLGAAIGMDIGASGFRGELEFSSRGNSLKGGRLDAVAQDSDLATFVFPSTGAVFHPMGVTVRPPGLNLGAQTALVSTTATFQANFATAIHDASNGNATTFALMANVWYDFDWDGALKPYVGGGVGFARTRVQVGGGEILQGEQDHIAWQIGGGVQWTLDPTTSLDVGFRYMDAGNVTVDIPTLAGPRVSFDHDIQHQSVTAGLVFKLE